jgi:hypothetical protein
MSRDILLNNQRDAALSSRIYFSLQGYMFRFKPHRQEVILTDYTHCIFQYNC